MYAAVCIVEDRDDGTDGASVSGSDELSLWDSDSISDCDDLIVSISFPSPSSIVGRRSYAAMASDSAGECLCQVCVI
jgi:hypothetical protein